MSERDKELFKGEDVDVDFYDVDPEVDDAVGLRGDLVRDLSDVHDEVRSVLSYGWDFEAFSGDSWWDFQVRYEGDKGRVDVSGRPDGGIDVNYRTDPAASMPDSVGDRVDYLNRNSPSLGSISALETESEGLRMRLEEDAEITDDSKEQRYLRDVLGLYVGADREASYPSSRDPIFDDRNQWWM